RLNANNWLNNKLGRPKSIFHRNDFGANAGGPVYLPKLYNGKNRTWFYFSYEGYRFPATAGVSQITLPTQRMLNGDFTDWLARRAGRRTWTVRSGGARREGCGWQIRDGTGGRPPSGAQAVGWRDSKWARRARDDRRPVHGSVGNRSPTRGLRLPPRDSRYGR